MDYYDKVDQYVEEKKQKLEYPLPDIEARKRRLNRLHSLHLNNYSKSILKHKKSTKISPERQWNKQEFTRESSIE